MINLWTPVNSVSFHINEVQIIDFKRGAKKSTGCFDSFLFQTEIKEDKLILISMTSLNYNHQWEISDYHCHDLSTLTVRCKNSIIHKKEVIRRLILPEFAPYEVIINIVDLKPIISAILLDNEKAVNDYKSGNKKALSYLIGEVLRKNKALDGALVKEQLEELLRGD